MNSGYPVIFINSYINEQKTLEYFSNVFKSLNIFQISIHIRINYVYVDTTNAYLTLIKN